MYLDFEIQLLLVFVLCFVHGMPRRNLIRTSEFPYHVTSRSRNKDWYELPMPEVWQIAMQSFQSVNKKFDILVHAFVLMNNHYHLLITTPDTNIDLVMQEFNKRFSLGIREKSLRINQIFGGRYNWSIIDNNFYLMNIYRYIYRNPVDAGIVSKVEDYPFSSLNSNHFQKEVMHHFKEEYDEKSLLAFYNQRLSCLISSLEERCHINKGLRKASFSLSRCQKTKKIITLPNICSS